MDVSTVFRMRHIENGKPYTTLNKIPVLIQVWIFLQGSYERFSYIRRWLKLRKERSNEGRRIGEWENRKEREGRKKEKIKERERKSEGERKRSNPLETIRERNLNR